MASDTTIPTTKLSGIEMMPGFFSLNSGASRPRNDRSLPSTFTMSSLALVTATATTRSLKDSVGMLTPSFLM